MKYRPLPVIERLTQSPDFQKEAAALLIELRQREGFQLLLYVLRDIERAALTALMTGQLEGRSPEFFAGQLQAVNLFRQGVDARFPDAAPTDWADEVSDVDDLGSGEAAEA